MTKKRAVIRVQLTNAAKNELTLIGDRLGIPQTRVMNRMLDWFFEQHPIVRNFITRLVPGDMAQSTAKLALTQLYR